MPARNEKQNSIKGHGKHKCTVRASQVIQLFGRVLLKESEKSREIQKGIIIQSINIQCEVLISSFRKYFFTLNAS